MGYALVTFSHADEAKFAQMLSSGTYFIGPIEASIIPKGNLDHSELDKSYFINKMRNDSKIVDKKAELKDSKKKLRDFESNIDKEMPSL